MCCCSHWYLTSRIPLCPRGLPSLNAFLPSLLLLLRQIMLNTDQHTPTVRVRMSCDNWIKPSRGVADGSSFPAALLRHYYRALLADELRSPPAPSAAATA